jgi:hypothetical protein
MSPALGRTKASWSEQPFLAHLLGGIRWAAGADQGSGIVSSQSPGGEGGPPVWDMTAGIDPRPAG